MSSRVENVNVNSNDLRIYGIYAAEETAVTRARIRITNEQLSKCITIHVPQRNRVSSKAV